MRGGPAGPGPEAVWQSHNVPAKRGREREPFEEYGARQSGVTVRGSAHKQRPQTLELRASLGRSTSQKVGKRAGFRWPTGPGPQLSVSPAIHWK